MSRYITVSTIGNCPPLSGEQKNGEAVKTMIKFWDKQLSQVLPDTPDLIVLPEVCDRFADMNAEQERAYYLERSDRVLNFFKQKAKDNHCYIAYSAIRQVSDGTFRNSTQLIDRRGKVAGIYNKNHPVIEETTVHGILGGVDANLIETDFGTVACVICFDLNFDELRLKYLAQKPDMILFSSMYHGGLMQAYWAYSCRVHFVGAIHNLPSAIISPCGETLAETTNYFNYVSKAINLDCKLVHLAYNQEKLSAAKHKYGQMISVRDPGKLGAVLLSSELEDKGVGEIIDEFKIETLDEYMQRALDFHHSPGCREVSVRGTHAYRSRGDFKSL